MVGGGCSGLGVFCCCNSFFCKKKQEKNDKLDEIGHQTQSLNWAPNVTFFLSFWYFCWRNFSSSDNCVGNWQKTMLAIDFRVNWNQADRRWIDITIIPTDQLIDQIKLIKRKLRIKPMKSPPFDMPVFTFWIAVCALHGDSRLTHAHKNLKQTFGAFIVRFLLRQSSASIQRKVLSID